MSDKYYIPSVSNSGVLSWTPTDDDMPPIPSVNIKGEKGQRGCQGRTGCILNANGTLNIEGLASEKWVTEELSDAVADKVTKSYVESAIANVTVDLTGYATEDYVVSKINQAQLGGADGSSIDLSVYALKSDLTNYRTEEQIIELIKANIPASGDGVEY